MNNARVVQASHASRHINQHLQSILKQFGRTPLLVWRVFIVVQEIGVKVLREQQMSHVPTAAVLIDQAQLRRAQTRAFELDNVRVVQVTDEQRLSEKLTHDFDRQFGLLRMRSTETINGTNIGRLRPGNSRRHQTRAANKQ